MDIARANHLKRVIKEEYLGKSIGEREFWLEEVRSLRNQLMELALSTESIDYILRMVPKMERPEPENPYNSIGKVIWV